MTPQELWDRTGEATARGQWTEAVTALDELLALEPNDLTARQRLADVLGRAGQFGRAVREYQHLIGAYLVVGQPLKALALGKLIQRLEPEHQTTPRALAALIGLAGPEAGQLPRVPVAMAQGLASGPLVEAPAPLWWPDLDDLPEQACEVAVDEGVVDSPVDRATLPAVPLFAHLPPEPFTALLRHLSCRPVPPGEAILREGDRGDSLFVLVQGKADVSVAAPDGGLRFIQQMPEGSLFGEIALMTRAPRLATIVAAGDCLLFEVTRARLAPVMVQQPAVKTILEEFYRERMLGHLVRASAIFRMLPPETQATLATRFQLQSVESGSEILRQGEENDSLYLILRGQCEVFTRSDTSYQEYGIRHEGDVLGEISLLWQTPVTATVRTLSPCSLMRLSRKDFDELVRGQEPVMEELRRLGKDRLTSMGRSVPL